MKWARLICPKEEDDMESDLEKYFPSRFLKGSVLDGPTKLTIAKVIPEEIGRPGEEEERLVVHWAEDAKPLVLNKTNFKSILDITGEPSVNDWAGTVVELFTIRGEWFGEVQDAIRIRAPTAGKQPKAAPKTEQSQIDKATQKEGI